MWPECREPGKGNKWEQWAVPGLGTAGSHAHCPAVPGTRLTSCCLPACCEDSGNPQECPRGTWAEGSWGPARSPEAAPGSGQRREA